MNAAKKGARKAANTARGAAKIAKPKARAALAPGDKVPDFTLPATGAVTVRLKDLLGCKLVLYFYPRDNTPGCTLEGQQFAALSSRFARAGVTIFGISRDSIASHERFRDKMGYPFVLLSDADGQVCKLFDVMREKHMYGRTLLGIERSTFLIDAKGVLQRQWRGVKVQGHATEVLAAAQAL